MKKETKQEILQEVLYILRTIVICSVAVFICTRLFVKPIRVDGTSMHPTLRDDDFGISFVLGSLLQNYHRFDVVIVYSLSENKELIKRIIGLPGETIEYKDSLLYVNGKQVAETFFDDDYVNSQTWGGTLDFTEDFGPVRLQEDEYFLMGDNRPASLDSRELGVFHSKDIRCKYALILFPFQHFNLVIHDN